MKKITKREEDYSQWYLDVIARADLAEHSVVRGCMVIKPYGYSIWEKIVSILDSLLKEEGTKNAYFPLFIPQNLLEKEKEHVEGFSPELAIVTHGGGSKLKEPLIVRPTSETIIYDSFSKWINSYRDLPLIINQWANVVRWEMRPRLFLRTTEFLWQEGHTAHVSLKEADQYALEILNKVYKKFAEEYLAMPVYTGKKSEKEKFAGALRTYCIEAMMQDGKSLQVGTSHNLSDNFSKSFDISFLDRDGQKKLVYQTSWGVSTRLIGGLIMTHSDDRGLVLPPKIAPIQVIIIPVKPNQEVLDMVETIKTRLKNFSIEIDNRDYLNPGEKYYEWEKKGVPLRIEIGPRDLENNQVVVARRDSGSKKSYLISSIQDVIKQELLSIQKELYNKAMVRRDSINKKADTWEELQAGIKSGGYVFAHWCGKKDCENNIKQETKAVSRFLPLEGDEEPGVHRCVKCGSKVETKKRWAFAKAY